MKFKHLNKNKKENKMESLDLMSTKKPFLYKGKSSYKTAFGGSLTILFIAVAVFISIFNMKALLEQSEYDILNKFEASSTDGWNPVNISVMLKINKTEEKLFWPYYQINEKSSINHNKTCTANELELLEEMPADPLFSYYCAQIDTFSRWSFKVRCFFDKAKKMGLECDSQNRSVTYKIFAQEFASESYSEIKNIIFELSNIAKNNTNFYYNFNKLIIDKDYFYSNPKIFYYSDFSDINSYPQWFANKDSVMSILLELKPQKSFVVEKSCVKFNHKLVNITALLQLFCIVFNAIYQKVADFLYEKENLRDLLEIVDLNEFVPQVLVEKKFSEVIEKSNLDFFNILIFVY